MHAQAAWHLLRDTYREWNADKAPRLGAALSYYSVFSMAPLLVVAIAIAGLVFEEEAARKGIAREMERTVGSPAAAAVEEMLRHTGRDHGGPLAAVVGLGILLFGASGVFVQLQDALNTIWKVAPRPGRGLWTILRERFLSFAAVLGTGFLLLTSLIISALLAALTQMVPAGLAQQSVSVWQIATTLLSFGIISLLFAMIFKLLPDAKVRWRDVWIGAALTAVLFTVGKYLISLYLGQGNATSAFGAAGSLVVLLIWVYYSAQILLFGAEFTRVFANRHGSPIVPTKNAVPVSQLMRARQGMVD